MHHLKRLGIMGFGMMGQHHAAVWSEIHDVEFAALAEPIEEKRHKAQELYGCTVYETVEEMLTRASLDMVIIATHVPLHYIHTLAAIGAGCHVVCEKPMACTLSECDGMIAQAKKFGVALAVHHQSIFSRAAQYARNMVQTGALGNLYLVRMVGKGRIACSDLMEIAGHLLHLTHYLVNEYPTDVYGDVTYQRRPITIGDACKVQNLYSEGRDSGIGAGDRMFGYYKFLCGVRAELLLHAIEGSPATFGEQRNCGYYVELLGTKKRARLYLPRTLFTNESPLDNDAYASPTPWIEVNPLFKADKDPVLTRLFAEDLIRAVDFGFIPAVSGEDGRAVMEMSLGVYESHFVGRPLSFPLAHRTHPFLR